MEKPSRSAIESALDDLKDAAMFSDEGVQMKRPILSFKRLYENERLKCLKQIDITYFYYLFNFMYNVLKFFNKKVFRAFKLEV